MSIFIYRFPQECSNLYIFRKDYKKQRDFFKKAYKMAENETVKKDILTCWEYVKRGIWSLDVETGKFTYN